MTSTNKVTWSRRGGYEVSSVGDKRFSAFYARMPDGRSIEHWFQCDVKGYDPGGKNWKLGKGKPPLSIASHETTYEVFKSLWRIWCSLNREKVEDLYRKLEKHNYVLSDCFASTPCNQARALADIMNEWIENNELTE